MALCEAFFGLLLESFKYLLGDLIGCLKKEKLSVLSTASEPMKCYLKSILCIAFHFLSIAIAVTIIIVIQCIHVKKEILVTHQCHSLAVPFTERRQKGLQDSINFNLHTQNIESGTIKASTTTLSQRITSHKTPKIFKGSLLQVHQSKKKSYDRNRSRLKLQNQSIV